MNAFIKRLLKSFGIVVRRPGKPRIDLDEFCDYLVEREFVPATVIDVGVAYGTPELYHHFPKQKFLLVEPLREWERTLKSIASKYDAEYVLAAAGSMKGTTRINVHELPSDSSLFKESDGDHADGASREIPVVTLDDVCREKALKGPYLLKIDAQGAELLVLGGATEVLKDTDLVIVETSLFEFFKGGAVLFDVMEFMKRSGFAAFDFFEISQRPLDRAVSQVCVAFVQEHGRFRTTSSWATKEYREKRIKVASRNLLPM